MSQLSQIFKDIADAIRSKTGSTDTLTPPQMANAINSIPSGGDAVCLGYNRLLKSNVLFNFINTTRRQYAFSF